MTQETKPVNIQEAWEKGLDSWHRPSIPTVIVPHTEEEMENLGEIGAALRGELAFMKYPEFQTYANHDSIMGEFSEDPQRGMNAVMKHEVGHRFCPYDPIDLILLRHSAKKGLAGKLSSVDDAAAAKVVNLYADMCINTTTVLNGDTDIPWAFQQLSKDRANSALWRVYGESMELRWDTHILPEGTTVNDKEEKAAKELSSLFERDFFDSRTWKRDTQTYASIIGEFMEEDKKSGGDGKDKKGHGSGKGKGSRAGNTGFDDITRNIPSTLDDKTAQELAKRLAEIGSNGLPSNQQGMDEFKQIMAGFGRGDPIQASISFYDMLSSSYDVMFATKPFGRPRVNPFEPIKWTPGMGAERLDVDYSVMAGGRIVPTVNTYAWNTRRREARGGLEEVVPNLDLYLDTSMSMPNPITQISLPVLAGFVAAKKAHRKGAQVRVTNFSGQGQYETQEFTRDLSAVFRTLVKHYNGGTVFPTQQLLAEGGDPKQAVIITDTFIANEQAVTEAISNLKSRNKGNNVAIYALSPTIQRDYLTRAGAIVIQGTGPDIFKQIIGQATEVYSQ